MDAHSEPLVTELAELARDAPPAAVIEAYTRVETRLVRLITAGTGHRGVAKSVDALAVLAAFAGVIQRPAVDAVQRISPLRDLIVRGDGDGVATAQAMEYLSLVDDVLGVLPKPH